MTTTAVFAALVIASVIPVGHSDCIITAKQCNNFPTFSGTQFPDKYGEELLDVGSPSKCVRRAEDFHHWCGNGRDSEKATVAATHRETMLTQIYHPTACDPKWSLYGKHCYTHVWEHKTWWEAEAWCNERGGNLCSIHGKPENEFVFTLTKGLSSWIGYNDVDQDEDYQWSDSTKTDFDNMNKNCTGRETEPDCQPEAVAQQWFNWEGHDRGTWVCKKLAKYGLTLMRNTTSLEALAIGSTDWETFKRPVIEDVKADPERKRKFEEERPEPKMEAQEQLPGLGSTRKKRDCINC